MKTEQVLIRLSKKELEAINQAYKQELINNQLISRSEFIRRLIEKGLGA
jgi:metal-responsive CopG/Arc/MetJ family transcriptional regulator